MTGSERPAPVRRAGTVTCGLVLVCCGLWMLVSLLFPSLDLLWAARLSPLALVSLGVEVLLAARGGDKIRYDWAGMAICLLVTGAALVLSALAWYVSWYLPALPQACP